ncbi:P-loop NTPase [Paenibacillus tarimensis]
MITKQTVLDVLHRLQEPGSDRKLVETGRVRDVVVKERDVWVTIVTSNGSESAAAKLRDEAAAALCSKGINNVHIRFRPPMESDRNGESEKSASAGHAEMSLGGAEVITIASGKGGVGKSTVTANLGAALAAKGKKVGVLDADIYGFSIPAIMGINEQPLMENNLIVPIEAYGVKIMSMGFFSEGNSPVVWRGPQLGKMLRTFFTLVQWGSLDYLLIDLPPGTGDIPLDLHAIIPQSKEIIVTTPHANASLVAARAGSLAGKMGHQILGVIENMSYLETGGTIRYIFGTHGGETLASELNTELLACIPLEYADDEQKADLYIEGTCIYRDTTRAGQIFLELAENILLSQGMSKWNKLMPHR